MTDERKEAILFQVNQQGIAVLKVNRPRARNALNQDAQDQFAACIEQVKSDASVRVLIITGSGDEAFVSGGDLKELLHNHDSESGWRLNQVMSQALSDLRRLPVFNRIK